MAYVGLMEARDGATVQAQQLATAESVLGAMKRFVESWERRLGSVWFVEDARELHESLERITADADACGCVRLASIGLELTVYLCAFADGATPPNAPQRAEIERMLDELAVACGVQRSGMRVRATPSAPARGRICLLSEPGALEATSVVDLELHGYTVLRAADPGQASAVLDEYAPDVLIVGQSHLAQLHELVEMAAKKRARGAARVACIALTREADAHLRYSALRAGADRVLGSPDGPMLAAALAEIEADRRQAPIRVLVVDDDRSQIAFCAAALRYRGMDIRACMKSAEVLRDVLAFRPDVLLLDLYLGDGNGIELAQQLRELPELVNLPIVFLSGEQDLEQRCDAIRLGGDDFLTKPVKPRHLVAMVESRARRARQLGRAAPRDGERDRRGLMAPREALLERLAHLAPDHVHALVAIAPADEAALSESLGFAVLGALARQIQRVIAAEAPYLKPLCADGDMRVIGLASARRAAELQAKLQALRESLGSRLWIAEGPERALPFRIVDQAVEPARIDAEAAIRRVRARLQEPQALECAQDPGTQPCAEGIGDAGLAPVHEALRRATTIGAICLEYLPLLPLKGEFGDQYRVRHVLGETSSPGTGVAAGIVLRLAEELGTRDALERQILDQSLCALAQQQRLGRTLRMHLACGSATLCASDFSVWLAGRMDELGVSPANIVLVLEARGLGPEPGRMAMAIESAQRTGVRLALRGLVGAAEERAWVELPGFDRVMFAPPASEAVGAWIAERGPAIAHALKHGKLVVAEQAMDTRHLSELMRAGVHYAESESLSSWMRDPGGND